MSSVEQILLNMEANFHQLYGIPLDRQLVVDLAHKLIAEKKANNVYARIQDLSVPQLELLIRQATDVREEPKAKAKAKAKNTKVN